MIERQPQYIEKSDSTQALTACFRMFSKSANDGGTFIRNEKSIYNPKKKGTSELEERQIL
jgi:hypothetical protein